MKTVRLTKGLSMIVDDADAETFSGRRLRAQSNTNGLFYAMVRMHGRSGPEIAVHRLLMGAPKALHVDHINGDTLDNRRQNLRVASNAENQGNRGKQSNNTSGFKGVFWDPGRAASPREKPWKAQIQVAGKKLSLGYFDTKEDAARAYDEAARKHFGAFAVTNF